MSCCLVAGCPVCLGLPTVTGTSLGLFVCWVEIEFTGLFVGFHGFWALSVVVDAGIFRAYDICKAWLVHVSTAGNCRVPFQALFLGVCGLHLIKLHAVSPKP